MKHLVLGICALLTLSLSGCAPQSKNNATQVRIRWARDPENLDPLVTPNPNALEAINLLYCSLLTVDYQKKAFVPWLVESMPAVKPADSLALITYQIRPEARWDALHPVLARDVAFTLKLMLCPGLPNEATRAQYDFIRDIRIDPHNPRRFTLVCLGRSAETIQASGDYSIFPEHLLDPQQQLQSVSQPTLRAGRFSRSQQTLLASFARSYQQRQISRNPVGCGAYELVSWQTNRQLIFRRKPDWWGKPLQRSTAQLAANPAEIDYQIIPDEATALLALRRGDIDVYPTMPAREFIQLAQSNGTKDSHLKFYTSNSYDMLVAGFNTRRPELRDAGTRRALSYLFDISGLIRSSQLGMATASVSLVSPQAGSRYNDSLPLLRFDPEYAQKLLQLAGWQRKPAGWVREANGQTQQLAPSFSYRAGSPANEAAVLQFRTAAARIGIPVSPRPVEASLFAKQLREGAVQIYLQQLSGNPFGYDFTPILHSQGLGWGNFTGFSTPSSDKLIEAIAIEGNPQRQAKLLRRFQQVLRTECPMVVLYFLKQRLAAASRLSNLHNTGLRPGYEAAAIISYPEKSGQQ